MMVPAAFVGSTVDDLAPLLDRGDTIIDGGNTWYREDIDRAGPLARDRGIDYVDVGTSGGVHGLERGYCLMVGGAASAIERLAPIFDSLAPGVDAAERTPTRAAIDEKPSSAERGWLHCGSNGAGHFVKMVHNGIEYGMMAAYAEGLNVLAKANIGDEDHVEDAETAPLPQPEYYRFDFDLSAITEVWRRGSVVASWLLDLTAEALAADPGARRLRRQRVGLRRRTLDRQRGDRRRRAGPRPVDVAVPALQLAWAFRRRRQGALGDARRVRRPRRAARRRRGAPATRCREPEKHGDDAMVVPAGAPATAEMPGRRDETTR